MNPTESTDTAISAPDVRRGTRYASPRHLLRWRTPHLAVLKMLAWVVREREGPNTAQLWRRCGELCPQIVEAVLGESAVSLDAICDDTLADQGAALTPSKLMQRADKTSRYREQNAYAESVERAYLAIRSETREAPEVGPLV